MNHAQLYRAGLISALLSTLGWIGFIVGSTQDPVASSLTGAAWVEALRSARTGMLIYGWGGTIGALLSIPYILAFHAATAQAGSVRTIATVAGILGASFTFLGFVEPLTVAHFILPAAAELGAAESTTLEAAAQTIGYVFEVPWFLGSFLIYGLASGLLAWYALRVRAAPRWINYVGIAGGVAGLIWLRPFITVLQPLAVPLSLANIVLLSVWCIALSLALVRRMA